MSPPGTNNTQGSRPKYTRVANACEKCKQVRKKCSNTVPCHQCVSKGLQCRKRAPPPTYRSLNAYSSSIEGGKVGLKNQASHTAPNQSSSRLVHGAATSNLSKKLSGLSRESISALIQHMNSGTPDYNGQDTSKGSQLSHRPVHTSSVEFDIHNQWPGRAGDQSFSSYEALTPARTRQSSWADSLGSTNSSFSDGNISQVPSTKNTACDTFHPIGFSLQHLGYPSPEQTDMPSHLFSSSTIPSQAAVSPIYNEMDTSVWRAGNPPEYPYPIVQGATYSNSGMPAQVPILASQGRGEYMNSGRTQYQTNIDAAASAPYTEVPNGHLRSDDQFYTNFGLYGQPIPTAPISTEMIRYSSLSMPPYMTPISPTTKGSRETVDFAGRYH